MDTYRAGSARTRLSFFALAVVLGLGLAGCERDYGEEFVENMVSRTDKFFDVAHATGDTFVIVGYNGRIIRSEDAGETWTEIESPAEWALTQVCNSSTMQAGRSVTTAPCSTRATAAKPGPSSSRIPKKPCSPSLLPTSCTAGRAVTNRP